MLFSDIDEYCRMRFRTTAGHQIILDDTNERIYISTAKGRNWIELDEGSGHINVYSASKINVHSENDINLCSDENINIVAKKRVNIESQDRGIKIQAKMGVEVLSREADVKISASRDLHLKTFNGAKASAVPELVDPIFPPYSGGPLGLTRDHAEAAGSDTSRILINAVENIEIRSDTQSLELTGSQKIDLRAIGADLTLHAGNNVNIKGSAIKTFAGGVGLNAVDGEEGLIPVVSKMDFGGSATIASTAAQVVSEDIKPKMVTPEHESWPRTTDETECPTPRNSKYLG
jgi:hypothetical protein